MLDLNFIISWWFFLFMLGIIFLPLTNLIFNRFADRGYLFSKVIAIIISSFIIWYAASLKIFAFSKINIIMVLIALAIINLFILGRAKDKFSGYPYRLALFGESLFLLFLIFWAFVRGNEPSIHGLEKFMDFGFVNSILRAKFFPPLDMWLAKSPDYTGGHFINYYYFGHYITAFLTKLTSIDSKYTYNLMMATLGSFTFVLSFSLALNIAASLLSKFKESKMFWLKIIFAGLLGGFLVGFAGNLHTIYTFTEGYPNEEPKPFWELKLGYNPEKYWYPNATRFIPFTIHEFPVYSFVVADLHGHVSDIPIVLTALAVIFSILLNTVGRILPKERPAGSKDPGFFENLDLSFRTHTGIPVLYLILIAFLCAVMFMTNAWDGAIYLFMTFLSIIFINLRAGWENARLNKFKSLYRIISATLFLIFFFLLVCLPFLYSFTPFASKVGVLCAPEFLEDKNFGPLIFEKDHCQRSPLWMLLVLWGFFLFHGLVYIFLHLKDNLREKWTSQNRQNLHEKGRLTKITDKVSSVIGGFIKNISITDFFVLTLIFTSFILITFSEFFYMRDIYPAHYRANTMFKLGYQAFMMMGIVSGVNILLILLKKQTLAIVALRIITLLLFTLVAVYPYFAVISYYGKLKAYQGLDGIKWIENMYPDDYKGILWLRENIKCPAGDLSCDEQPVIIEANGESYTDYARISANTGLPTVIGWPVHEWLWRGSYDEAGLRIPEVAAIYESIDIDKTRSLLKKYNARYVFIGKLEKDKYPALNLEKLENLGSVIFESGQTKIIRLNPL